MEVTGNTGNTDANKIDLTNVREVHVYNEDGSIKETFWFPITPPRPIVIEDSSDTETEDEEGEEEEVADKKEEAEQQEEKEEKADEDEAEEAEKEKEEEEEEVQQNKRRRIGEPAPVRADRSAYNRSYHLTALQPAPSITQQEPEPGNELDPPLDIATPPSPLPTLDPDMDIVAVLTEHGM